jgi:hypothetical protein
MSDPTSTVDAPASADVANLAPIEVPTAPVAEPVEPQPTVAPAIRTGPIESLIDGWFADHFSDQVFSRESTIWEQAHQAKEHLKALVAATTTPVFDGLIDQWFWDSFSNTEFSHNVSVWNLAYDAKQKLKFLLATR